MEKLYNLTKDALINLYINDKELLKKVKKVMGSEHKITPSKHHKDSVRLFNILYKNIENQLFLDRKYTRFLEGLKIPSMGAEVWIKN